jgi:predicted amidophosphoribosyltransferase
MAAWECPECNFVKDVICPVCGEDKEAGTTCGVCGSEFSHTTCPECGYSQRHMAALDHEKYEEKIKKVLKDREEKYLTYYELIRLCDSREMSGLKGMREELAVEILRAFLGGERR